jgi:tRNA pseudouridine38-40 synthase
MPRYRLLIEYDGGPYTGFQAQTGQPTVQGSLEQAVLAFCGEAARVHAAGRTDSGVHALGQVVSFDLGRDWDPFRIREALNFHTKPYPVAILSAEAVPPNFEARFSAVARHYEYRILNRRGRPALDDRRVWHCPMPLDAAAMHAAAQLILGKHDFTTFRAAECQAKSPEKTLDRLDVSREGDIIVVRAGARSFLHSQVRSIVGSLKLVGEGKWAPRQFRAALDARDRARCGPLAPPDGLYLVRVDYPSELS